MEQQEPTLNVKDLPSFVIEKQIQESEGRKGGAQDVSILSSNTIQRKDNVQPSVGPTPSAADAFDDRESYLRGNELELLKDFIRNVLSDEDPNIILSEDFLAVKEYREPFVSAVYTWERFSILRKQYKSKSRFTKKTSVLQNSLQKIQDQEEKVAHLLKQSSEVPIDKSKGANVFGMSYVRKSQLLSAAVVEMAVLNGPVSDVFLNQICHGVCPRLVREVMLT